MKNDKNHITPPRFAEKVLLWFLREELAEEVLGDLDEKFYQTVNKKSIKHAKRNYWYQVFNYLRPFAFKFLRSKYLNNNAMIKHNFKISYRQMLKNKAYSFINIGGLAIGMAVAMLIGLWINDELSFNKNHDNYDSIVQVLRHEKYGDEWSTNNALTTGMGTLFKESYPDIIDDVVMVRARTQNRVISHEDRKFRQTGIFLQEGGPKMLGLDMLYGTQDGLKDLRSIMLSESFSKKLFGDENPLNKTVKIDGGADLIVGGVYKDLPKNSRFSEATYFCRLAIIIGGTEYLNVWDNYNVDIYLKVNPKTDLTKLAKTLTATIESRIDKWAKDQEQALYLHPMKDWRLRSEFKDTIQVTSQEMKFVWLYGIIGLFVLALACINFMNLSTARSEKRAKEVGIRKTLGSLRKQLIAQFYIESFLYSLLAFALSLFLLYALLPWFNDTSGKEITSPWQISQFWLISCGFVILTSLLSGSYPATYLSSFKPIKALKGINMAGKRASIPRKVLVVFQFTISIALIIGTITVNNQIQVAKERPIGYSPKGMLSIRPASPNYGKKKRTLLRNEILKTGMASAVGASNYPVTSPFGWNPGFTWEGMDPSFDKAFNTISISKGYGDAVGLKFIAGRDFSDEHETDRNSIIINRSAMEAMNLENPIGTIVTYNPSWREARTYTIIGVVEDMIKGSPFEETFLSVMFLEENYLGWLYMRLNPDVSASTSIPAIEKVFKDVLPEAPFDFSFADDDYNKKFEAEQRIGRLASFFSILAILISCLGLFGLASYVAEQRTKEIGIRKILGASVANLWKLLSKDFALLVFISCFIAIPISYSVLNGWLEGYEVKTKLYWWVFAIGGLGALTVTLITVSFQALKAATANPVNSLRSE